MTIYLLAPAPLLTYTVSSGRVYVSDQNGMIFNTLNSAQDQVDLVADGCQVLQVVSAASPVPAAGGSVAAVTQAALPSSTYSSGVLTATGNGALPAQDGVTLTVNQRLLVRRQADMRQNMLGTVTQVGTGGTPWIISRASDANSAALVSNILITAGGGTNSNGRRFWCPLGANAISLDSTYLPFIPAD